MEVLDRPSSQIVLEGDTEHEQLASRHQQRDLADVCGQLNVAHYRLIELLAEAIETKSWCGYGIKSPEHWVSWQAGLSPARAKAFVKIAERFHDLPVAFAAFRDGLLSIDQLSILAAYSQPFLDEQLTSLARYATLPQLGNALSKVRFLDGRKLRDLAGRPDDTSATDPVKMPETGSGGTAGDGDSPAGEPAGTADPAGLSPVERAAMDPGWLSHQFTDDGRLSLRADMPADVGSLVAKALAEARDRLFREGNQKVTWVDALADIAARSLGAVASPSRRDLYRTYIHLDVEGAWIDNGPSIPKALFEKLTCDGVVKPVWHETGIPVNVGASHAVIPPHTRRLILDRDRSCRYPGCTKTRNLEIHHIRYRKRDNGPGETGNLAGHCGSHHTAGHRNEFTVSGNADEPDGLVYRKPDGQIIHPAARPRPPGDEVLPAPPDGQFYRHPLGEPFHYDLLDLPSPPDVPARHGPSPVGRPDSPPPDHPGPVAA